VGGVPPPESPAQKNMKLRYLPLLILMAAPCSAVGVELVDGREYVSVLKREIGQAKKSITACLFLYNPSLAQGTSETLLLADALAQAATRGVKVEVILDGSPDWERYDPAGLGKNATAYEYLAAKGVDVSFTSAPATVHAKVVVFDEAVVLAGSTNWSEAAFHKNIETNLLVRDPAAAREALQIIRSAGRRRLPKGEDAARLPAAFLTGRYAGKLIRGREDRAFDLYLILLRESHGGKKVSATYQVLADFLAITVAPRDQVQRTLKSLQKDGLIHSFPRFREESLEVELVPLEGETVGIPADYWRFGWDKRLTTAGEVSYFLSKHRSEHSPRRPRWSASLAGLVKETGLSPKRLVESTAELRRANLLEVEHDELTKHGGVRAPNVYTPRDLYDPATLSAAWADLRGRFGEEKLARARRCAALVYEDSDVDVVERLIHLEESHGREKVEEAYQYIALKHPSNPRRTAAYFFATIQGD
jgi:hypothetical protein